MSKPAIILCAGRGTRLSKYTTNAPKCFLPIKYGQSLIDRVLRQLHSNGVRDVIIVLGYREKEGRVIIDQLKEKYIGMNLSVAVNKDYLTTGTLASLLIGLDASKTSKSDSVFVIEGDVVCDDVIVRRIIGSEANTLMVDYNQVLDKEAMKFIASEEVIQSMGKSIKCSEADGEFIGISNLRRDVFDGAKVLLGLSKLAFYESVIHAFAKESKFKTLDVNGLRWSEIDFPSDYKKARQMFTDVDIMVDKQLFENTTHSPSVMSICEDLDVNIIDHCFLANPYLVDDEVVERIGLELKQLITSYPPQQSELQKIVAKFSEVDEGNVLVGNGASELITHTNICWNRCVPIPTFSEYLTEVEKITTYQLREEDEFNLDVDDFKRFCKKSKCDDIVLINPNNPVGRVLSKEEIMDIAGYDVGMIVDESFIDFCDPKQSLIPYVNEFKNINVIKSFGKIFGVPGLRLGVLFANEKSIEYTKMKLPTWNINSVATYFLNLMNEQEFRSKYDASIAIIKDDVQNMYQELSKIDGIKAYEPTSNYVFLKIMNGMTATELRDVLLRDGIYIRDCTNKEGLGNNYVRIASRTHIENISLIEQMKILLADKEENV